MSDDQADTCDIMPSKIRSFQCPAVLYLFCVLLHQFNLTVNCKLLIINTSNFWPRTKWQQKQVTIILPGFPFTFIFIDLLWASLPRCILVFYRVYFKIPQLHWNNFEIFHCEMVLLKIFSGDPSLNKGHNQLFRKVSDCSNCAEWLAPSEYNLIHELLG